MIAPPFFLLPRCCITLQVLERVAVAYPRALFFPLLMTKASAARRNGGGGTGTGNDGGRLSKLTALTADPIGEAFAQVCSAASSALGIPAVLREHIFGWQKTQKKQSRQK